MLRTIRNILNEYRKNGKITAWTLGRALVDRDELYLVSTGIEQVRSVHLQRILVTVFVERETEKGKMTGSATRAFRSGSSASAVREQLDEVVFAASLAINPYYTLDVPRDNDKAYPACDPEIASDRVGCLAGLRDRTIGLVEKEEGVRIASAEIFLSHSDNYELNSMGLDHHDESTRITYELVLTAGSGEEEVESHLLFHERFIDRLDIDSAVARYAAYARDNLHATLPPSGIFDVILTEDALEHIFSPFEHRVAASSIYRKMSDATPGDDILDNVSGDRITLSYDPGLPGGLLTRKYDRYGTLLEKVRLIGDGVVENISADRQYASYLDLPVTGMAANTVVEAGTTPFDDLVADNTFLLSRFSSFTPDTLTGDFSGEIRNGLFFRDGRSIPVKGGSISGSIFKAFRKAFLSKETIQQQSYHGPKYIKLCDVSVTGR